MEDFENKSPEGERNENISAAASEEKAGGENPKSGVPMRTYLIMILAGVYVAYLGVSLCQDVIKRTEGSSPGFMVAGIEFIVLGVVFVVSGLRNSMKLSKAKKEQEAVGESQLSGTEPEAGEAQKTAAAQSSPFQGKKMSIAERANLVNQLGDANEDEKE